MLESFSTMFSQDHDKFKIHNNLMSFMCSKSLLNFYCNSNYTPLWSCRTWDQYHITMDDVTLQGLT